MPYQGSQYVPPAGYANYRNYGGGQAHLYHQQNGQAPQQQMGRYAQPNEQVQFQHQAAYHQQPASQAHTQYATPQYYNQGQGQSSFYQTPSPSIQYQPQQQPYLSPPLQQTSLPPNQYSPDPLSRGHYQAAPQPRQTPQQGYPQQFQQGQRPPTQTPQAPRPQSSSRNSLPQNQWPKFPASPYEASPQSNLGSTARNAQLPQQQLQRPQAQATQPARSQSQHSQHSLGRSPSLSEVRRSSPAQGQRPAQHQPGQQAPRPQPVKQPQQTSPQIKSEGLNPQVPPAQHQIQQPSQPSRPTQPSAQAEPPATIDPSVLFQQNSRVQSSAQSSTPIKLEDPMPRSPKRRRSNDGQAIPVCEPPRPQSSSKKQHASNGLPRVQNGAPTQLMSQDSPASSPLTQLASSQMPPTPTPAVPVDYQAVLLGLSDEYIKAAYSMSNDLAAPKVDEDVLDRYHSLLATGMGCLDAILKNYRIPEARKEARIRLRLASLMVEETENDEQAEDVLNKGISICERAHLTDLKYAMQHLLARTWFKAGKYKAAMNNAEKLAVEAEKLQLLHWVYAFRFLRVSFGLQVPGTQPETIQLVRHLNAITAIAHRNYHVHVQIIAATLEALVQLRSRSADSVDLAMRALAAARTHQLGPEMTAMPQARALLACIDVSCSLLRFSSEQLDVKLASMQGDMDKCTRDGNWRKDGLILVPLGLTKDIDMMPETAGIFQKGPNGETSLVFSWLTKAQMYAHAFLMSGLGVMHKNASSEQKAEMFLKEGLKLCKLPTEGVPQSMTAASTRLAISKQTRVLLLVYATFAYCGRADWENAQKGIPKLNEAIEEMGTPPSRLILSLVAYLDGVSKHGLGDLDGALRLYQSRHLRLDLNNDAKVMPGSVDSIRVLAALNSVGIMRLQGHVAQADQLLNQVEPFCLVTRNNHGNEHGDKSIEAVFYILKAMSPTLRSAEAMIIRTKEFLQKAVKSAQAVSNNQLLSIVMNIMTVSYFKNIVGDQAEKSASAGRTLAKNKCQDKLWTAVADRMYADTLEKSGKMERAAGIRAEAQQAMRSLPESLRAALAADEDELS